LNNKLFSRLNFLIMPYRINFSWLFSLIILGLSANLVFQACKKDNTETPPAAAFTAKELAKDRDFVALAVLVQDQVARSPFLSRHYDRTQKKAMSLQVKQICEAENLKKSEVSPSTLLQLMECQGFQSVEDMKRADAELWALRTKLFNKYPELKQLTTASQRLLGEAFICTGVLNRYQFVADRENQNYFLIDNWEKSAFKHLLPVRSRCYPSPCTHRTEHAYSCCEEAWYRLEDAHAACNEAFFVAILDCPDAYIENAPSCILPAINKFAECANMAYDRYINDLQKCDPQCQ
jgi:hypothetical protein